MALPPRAQTRPRARTLLLALLLSTLLHATLWETLPTTLRPALHATLPPQTHALPLEPVPPKALPEELLPEEFRAPKPRFVEINPEAPTQRPPETANTGAATQRAAQPTPATFTHDDMPKLDGESPESTHLVDHLPRQLLPAPQQPPPGQPLGQPPSADGPPPAQDLTQLPPETPHGTLAHAPQPGKHPHDLQHPNGTGPRPVHNPGPQTSAPREPSPLPPAPNGDTPLPAPQPRPQAVKVGTTGILLKNPIGTNEAGTLSLDAKYSEFGDYAQRMIEIIQATWWLILERGKIHPTPNTTVIVQFTLCKDGTLKDVTIAHTTATPAATYACKDAIESRAPYDPWRPDMIAMLGGEERAKFTFHYR